MKLADDAINMLNSLDPKGDTELQHSEAEEILCGFLRDVGYEEVASAFEEARDRCDFWYA